MTTMISVSARHVREAVRETVSTFAIPAAQIAWWCDGSIDQIEIGSATSCTRFSLGSVTKVCTASLALQLVGDGLVGLDEPIAQVLPAIADEPLGAVTLRHLLSHSSGVENDHSSGRLDFASPRELVSACAGEPLLFRSGRRFSYSNAGLVVAGRVVEAATGLPYWEAAQAFLLDPLDVRGLFYLSDAFGASELPESYVRRPDGGVVAAAPPPFGAGWAPACGLALDARGLLRLVALYLREGRTPHGIRLLEPSLVAEARARQVSVPDRTFADAWGLGWSLVGDDPWFGHSGHTAVGQAFVRASERADFAVAMLASCAPVDDEWRRLLSALASIGLEVGDPAPAAPAAAAAPIDRAIAGLYVNGSMRFTVEPRDGGWWLCFGGRALELRSVGIDRYVSVAEVGASPRAVLFIRDDDYRIGYLHVDGRTARRVGEVPR